MSHSILNIDAQHLLDSIPPGILQTDLLVELGVSDEQGAADGYLQDSPQSSLQQLPQSSPQNSPQNLKTAFDLFNQLSLQLADSYQHLEKRVADLSSELDSVSEQRYQELQQKEQIASRLETLINVLPGGVVVLDKKGVVIESNPVAETFLEPSLTGQYWRDVIKRCFAPKDDDGHEVSNREGKRISIVTRSLDDDGQIILLTDQTETRQLQANLSRNERLSALGKMVSTLAHQVRTPLSSAVLYANHLSTETLSTTQRQSFTNKLLNRLNFMERQIRDMLLFVKGDMPLTDQVSLTELQDTLAESIEMPIKAYGANCQLQRAACDREDSTRAGHRKSESYLQCNLDALIGALLNLVNNSLQTTSSAEIIIQFKINNDQLAISILDNGPGFDCEQKENIQDMFFTTKEQGTGIGLSVVNIVAQSHGGSFELTNRKQGGACARLCLPLV